MMDLNLDSLKSVKIKVAGNHVGTILVDDSGLHSLHCINVKNDDKEWTARDNKILFAAVNTLGSNNWGRVAKYWFNELKTREECEIRWESIKDDVTVQKSLITINNRDAENSACDTVKSSNHEVSTNSSYSQKHFNHNLFSEHSIVHVVRDNNKHRTIRNNNLKQISQRKRRELEVLEERRLFGKERSEIEKELIERAFFVGQTKLEKIMRMNNAESKEKNCTTISFSSIITEMMKINPSNAHYSHQYRSKHAWKPQRAMKESSEPRLTLSPTTNDDDSHDTLKKKAKKSLFSPHGNHLLNFHSTQLPVREIIESERVRLSKTMKEKRRRGNSNHLVISTSRLTDQVVTSHDDDKENLTQYMSPPMKRPFPYLN